MFAYYETLVIHENITTVLGILNEYGYRKIHEIAAEIFRTTRRRGANKW